MCDFFKLLSFNYFFIYLYGFFGGVLILFEYLFFVVMVIHHYQVKKILPYYYEVNEGGLTTPILVLALGIATSKLACDNVDLSRVPVHVLYNGDVREYPLQQGGSCISGASILYTRAVQPSTCLLNKIVRINTHKPIYILRPFVQIFNKLVSFHLFSCLRAVSLGQ